MKSMKILITGDVQVIQERSNQEQMPTNEGSRSFSGFKVKMQ